MDNTFSVYDECFTFMIFFLFSVIEQLGGKQLVMQLLAHEDPNVRYEALLAVQKLMVHNSEYLRKQLEKEQTTDNNPPKGATPVAGKA